MSDALTILVVSNDEARYHAALSIAAANAALGGATRVHLHAEAAALAVASFSADFDDRYAAAGLPRLTQLIDDAIELGVRLTVCQTGLTLAGLEASQIDPRIEASGLIAVLAEAQDARITTL